MSVNNVLSLTLHIAFDAKCKVKGVSHQTLKESILRVKQAI